MTLRVSFEFARGARIPVGRLWESGRDTVFQYDASFLGCKMSPAPFKLPLGETPVVYDHSGEMETFGLFEDSLPDGWGRRLVDQRFRQRHGRVPTVLERLSCVGRNGMGALVYEPVDADEESVASFDFAELAANAMAFDAQECTDVLPALRKAGGSSGGARPKAFVAFNPQTGEVDVERDDLPSGFEHWLVKFNTRSEGDAAGAREFRYYRLAREIGVDMAESRLLDTSVGRFFATRRFDRDNRGGRVHVASAAGLLHANFRVPGDEYEMLFRLTDALTRDYAAKRELFARVALNVLAHNRDDHLKNFAFTMDAEGCWRLAPFYDFTYAEGPNGWQTLSVSGEGANPTERDLLRLAEDVSLKRADAADIVARVRSAVSDFNKEEFT